MATCASGSPLIDNELLSRVCVFFGDADEVRLDGVIATV
jgi:hypothetical protein